ncbi:hypothetical protein M422DRAFT_255710, partial [Sphaerobolus stellatus SS14]
MVICRAPLIVNQDSAVLSRTALENWLLDGLQKPTEKPKATQDKSNSDEPEPSQSDVIERSQDATQKAESPDPLDSFSEKPVDSEDHKKLSTLSITCQHGALDPRKTSEMKRIKMAALASIQDMGYVVEPKFMTDDICSACIEELFLERRYTLDHASHTEKFEELFNIEDDSEGAWISKSWLRDWRQALPKMHVRGQDDPDPEAPDYIDHVKCPHGKLSSSTASRQWINGQ